MKKTRAKALLLPLALSSLLSACTQWRYELGEPLFSDPLPDDSSQLQLADVLATLGPPLRLSAAGEGYVLAWEYWTIDEDTIGLRLGALGADIVSVDWGDAELRGEFLLVTFNHQHQVTGHTYSRWSNDGGDGQALQPIGLVSLVDVEDMVGNMPQHAWGAGMLRPLPEAINMQSRPDAGQSGIQQRGTPRGVGQRSLE